MFGEAANQPYSGQIAVAYTIVNRVTHPGYPNTISGVLGAKYRHDGVLKHEYNTLDLPDHTRNWEKEKSQNSYVYRRITRASIGALCGTEPDPTKCAVVFCYPAGCPAIQSNPWWRVHDIKQIGDHFFGCKSQI